MRVPFGLVVPLVSLAIGFLGERAGAQGKPEKDKIRIGYAARAVTHSIPFLASEAGFFRDEGLQVEVVRTAGAVSPMVLISGDTDFATMSSYLLIPVSVRNRDVVMLGGLTRYASMTLVSRPEIRGAKELKGGIIGLQRPGDAYEKNARSALEHLKLNPDKDVKFLYLGTNDAMWFGVGSAQNLRDGRFAPGDFVRAQGRHELPGGSIGAEDRVSGVYLRDAPVRD